MLREIQLCCVRASKIAIILTISEVINCNFGTFQPWKIAQICQNSTLKPLKLSKRQFLRFWIHYIDWFHIKSEGEENYRISILLCIIDFTIFFFQFQNKSYQWAEFSVNRIQVPVLQTLHIQIAHQDLNYQDQTYQENQTHLLQVLPIKTISMKAVMKMITFWQNVSVQECQNPNQNQ